VISGAPFGTEQTIPNWCGPPRSGPLERHASLLLQNRIMLAKQAGAARSNPVVRAPQAASLPSRPIIIRVHQRKNMTSQCTDKICGQYPRQLALWTFPALRRKCAADYESHFADCSHCQSRRKLHRIVDFFPDWPDHGFGVGCSCSPSELLTHFAPRHALLLELAALFGFGLCAAGLADSDAGHGPRRW